MSNARSERTRRREIPRPSRRDEIIATASELFADRGYQLVTMDDIANAVGLAKPSLYHYFTSKEQLLFLIHGEFIEPLIAKQQARMSSNASAAQKLKEVIYDLLAVTDSHRGHVRVFFEHHQELRTEDRESIGRQRREYRDSVAEILREGIATGEFQATLDTKLVTLAIFGMCNWAYQWFDKGGKDDIATISEVFASTILNGIGDN